VLGLATGEDVKVDVVADGGVGDDGVFLVLSGELGEGVVGVGGEDGVLFDPADLVFLGFDAEEAAAVLEDFKLLAVDHLADAVGDGGDAVVEVHLPGGYVDGLVVLGMEALAAGSEQEQAEQGEG
jgi:hypothetical protein